MKFKATTCYSHILFMMFCHGKMLAECTNSVVVGKPGYDHEGMAGYLETTIEVDIKDLTKFAILWDSWYTAPNRDELYAMAKGAAREGRICS